MNPGLDLVAHYVYRYYNADDQALYIGCTHSVAKREAQHRPKPWFPLIARREVERYENKFAGRLAEQAWIQREQPIHNQQRKYEPYSGDALWFEIHTAIAADPGRISAILARYEPVLSDRIRIAESTVEAENKMWRRTKRRLRESRCRAAYLARKRAA